MGRTSRATIVHRVDLPDGTGRAYLTPHFLSGYGKTLDEAKADLERLVRELAEDGLEVVGRLPEPRASSSGAHSESFRPSAAPTAWHYGYGRVQIRVQAKKR